MKNVFVTHYLFIIVVAVKCASGNNARPNIVFIIADDLGWDDVSFHGSDQVLTPNIDLLAYTGVALERHYSHCVCTPSRAALMTGKFAHTIGMHGYPLTNGEDRGLPLSEKLLPEYLKEIGYATHLVGKWHLGQSRTVFLPTNRGFDSHFGYRGGFIDYYEYIAEETIQQLAHLMSKLTGSYQGPFFVLSTYDRNLEASNWTEGVVSGMDMYRNLTPAWDVEGYITDVFTMEAKNIIKSHDKESPLFLMVAHTAPHSGNDGALLQAPPEIVRSMRHVELGERRTYTAMVKKLDDSVGEILNALEEENLINNTIVIFISDNGGMTVGSSINYASNWPLRGTKLTAFEGGVRTAGIIWSPGMTATNNVWKGYIHLVDWLPTLLGAIGVTPPNEIDGLNMWDTILNDQESKRSEIIEWYTYPETGFKAITSGDYKLIIGNVTKDWSELFGEDFRGVIGKAPSYTKVLEQSKMYALLNRLGKPFNMSDKELRNRIKVNCGVKNTKIDLCYPENDKPCLYNIKEDPCETRDLSMQNKEITQRLLERLAIESNRTVQRLEPLIRDPRALPSLHEYTWAAWADSLPML